MDREDSGCGASLACILWNIDKSAHGIPRGALETHVFNANVIGRLSEMRQHATQQDKNGSYCSDRSFGH
jgi:hypothetical protein